MANNTTGFLVPPSNSEEMATALYRFISDPEKRQQQGENSHRRVLEHFSILAMVNQYTDVYDSVIAKGKQ